MRLTFDSLKNRATGTAGCLVLAGLAFFSQGCRRAPKPAPKNCVAYVRDTCIERKFVKPPFRVVAAKKPPQLSPQTAPKWVLDGLIERELLAQEAEKEGIKVTDAEVAASTSNGLIYMSSSVQRPVDLGLDAGVTTLDALRPPPGEEGPDAGAPDGGFDADLKTLLSTTPADFKAWQEREILAAKMRDRIRSAVKIADEDAFKRFQEERTTDVIEYVFVYRKWVERFAMAVNDAEVAKWAAENPEKVMVPVRHILITFDKEGDKEAARQKAQALLDRVKKGEDIAKLADEFSQDPGTKDKGGEYAGEMVQEFVPEFQASVKKLKPGELDPNLVQTSYGFHVIKRDPATREYNVRAWKEAHSEELTKKIAAEIHTAVAAGKDPAAAAAAAVAKWGTHPEKPGMNAATDVQRPQAVTSKPFMRSGMPPIPLVRPDATKAVVEFAFRANPNEVMPTVVDTFTGSIVVKEKERKVPTQEDFAKEHDAYVGRLLHQKQEAELRSHVNKLREDAKDQITIDEEKLMGKRDGGAPEGGVPQAAPPPPPGATPAPPPEH